MLFAVTDLQLSKSIAWIYCQLLLNAEGLATDLPASPYA